jgi:hypothetical protein
MEPQERTQLISRLLDDATHMHTVLEQAMAAKAQEAAQIEASGHITDDEPLPTPVFTLEAQQDAWAKIARALSEIHTELHQLAQWEPQQLEQGTSHAVRSQREEKDASTMRNDGESVPRTSFTLTEAKHWIGRTVITKAAFEVEHRKLEAEQQGTVIGVHGEHALQGDPNICLVVQLWLEEHDRLPEVFFFPKHVFDEYLCLSHTVASPTS